MSVLSKKSPEELMLLDWGFVHKTLQRAKDMLEADGTRQSWIDPALDISSQNRLKNKILVTLKHDT